MQLEAMMSKTIIAKNNTVSDIKIQDLGVVIEASSSRTLSNNFDLEEIATSFRSRTSFEGIYRAIIPKTTSFKIDPEEVAEVRWFAIPEFENLYKKQPDIFPPGFLKAWEKFRDELTI